MRPADAELAYMRESLDELERAMSTPYAFRPPGNPYDALVPIAGSGGFLHWAEYSPSRISPAYANAYFRRNPQAAGGCSGVFKDGKVLRTFDWTYDDSAQFVVRMKPDPSRGVLFGSVGMAFTNPVLSRRAAAAAVLGAYDPYFAVLPYTVVDGVNDAGIYAQANVVPGGFAEINPAGEECCAQTMLVRFVLDRLGSLDGLDGVLSRLRLYGTGLAGGYGIHVMVADSNRTRVVEFEEDGFEIVEGLPLLTNFRTNRGFRTAGGNFPVWETVEPYGMGVERWEKAAEFLEGGGRFESLRDGLKYTNAYGDGTDPPWLTEICAPGFTVQDALDVRMRGEESPHYERCMLALAAMREKYLNRSRSAKGLDRTWQTVHSCLYDVRARTAELEIQEGAFGRRWRFWL